ncbi:MAG: 5-formyltetrahydrofolate cyclo-ligase [Vulcanococcus sp.]
MADNRSKPALRRHYHQRRRETLGASPAARTAIARAAAAPLAAWLPPGSHLGLYWPIQHEPDLRPLAQLLTAPQITRLALPAIEADQLHYRPWAPSTPLQPDGCGIPAPAGPGALASADMGLLLAPALALDHHGIRLGYGGGWFDRLRADPAWRRVPALAVLPAACLCETLPRDPWDVPFDGWLDEHGLHWLQAL